MSKSTKPRIFEGILENKILVMHHEKKISTKLPPKRQRSLVSFVLMSQTKLGYEQQKSEEFGTNEI